MIPVRFFQTGDDQVVRIIYPLKNLWMSDALVKLDRVPVFFIHVVSGGDSRMFLPDGDGIDWITFQVNAVRNSKINQAEHFIHYFKNKGRVVKWKFARRPLFFGNNNQLLFAATWLVSLSKFSVKIIIF